MMTTKTAYMPFSINPLSYSAGPQPSSMVFTSHEDAVKYINDREPHPDVKWFVRSVLLVSGEEGE